MVEGKSEEEVRLGIGRLAEAATDFVLAELDFCRMFLYRILENSDDIIDREVQLQDDAVDLVNSTFAGLVDAGAVRPVDTRTLAISLLCGYPMMVVSGVTKPQWFGGPSAQSPEGRQRLETSLRANLESLLLP